jgi:hypothetical protein
VTSVPSPNGNGLRAETAFYTLADTNHFLGVVALLNSMRLVGHGEPLIVTDAGLTDRQRAMLAPHAEVFSPIWRTGEVVDFLRHQAPLRDRRHRTVIVDSDVIVLRSLGPLLDLADQGSIVAVTDGVPGRFYAEWGELLNLGTAAPHTYVNTGFAVYPADPGLEVMELVRGFAHLVGKDRTMRGAGASSDPFYYSEQDVFNGVMACRPPSELVALPHGDGPHPPFTGLKVADPASLAVETTNGRQPYVMHHVLAKPWLANTPENAYSQLLPRLLLADDLTIRLRPDEVPRRFRSGWSGVLARKQTNAAATARNVRGRAGIRRRLLVWRDRVKRGR